MKNDVTRFGLLWKRFQLCCCGREIIFVLPVQKHSRAVHFWEAGLRENLKIICTTAFEEIVDFKYTVTTTGIYWANSF